MILKEKEEPTWVCNSMFLNFIVCWCCIGLVLDCYRYRDWIHLIHSYFVSALRFLKCYFLFFFICYVFCCCCRFYFRFRLKLRSSYLNSKLCILDYLPISLICPTKQNCVEFSLISLLLICLLAFIFVIFSF